jgi:hypothetical protein
MELESKPFVEELRKVGEDGDISVTPKLTIVLCAGDLIQNLLYPILHQK